MAGTSPAMTAGILLTLASSALGEQNAGRVRHLDVDFERRDLVTTIQRHLDAVEVDGDVLGDDRENRLAQDRQEVGLRPARALMGKQDLQAFASDRRGRLSSEQVEQAHAALRRNSLSSRPLRSVGMVIGTSWPLSRRAASA